MTRIDDARNKISLEFGGRPNTDHVTSRPLIRHTVSVNIILVASMSISQPKLMYLTEARLFTKFLAGASLLMYFHLGGHCRQGYDVTHSSFLAGCTRRLPGILAYHYHTHHPAAWSKISKYISKVRWF